jgi:hypothetical protein
MSYIVKDFWKNVIVEFDYESELNDYISSSLMTSSVAFDEDVPLNYFQYDYDLHQNLYSSSVSNSSLDSLEIFRITYQPGHNDDDINLEEIKNLFK